MWNTIRTLWLLGLSFYRFSLTSGRLPIGLQLIGRPFEEARLLRVGRALERELNLVREVPPCR